VRKPPQNALMTLSDDAAVPDKWRLPDVTVPARGFVLLWLDGNSAAGPLHAPFALSAGMTLSLSHDMNLIDRMTIPTLNPNQSYGRFIDWTGNERKFFHPTPGIPNTL
ncbi:MAG: hypothetical protein NTV22_10675, partial [bacterium]|nr:hypothetical protein [bacterium]